MSHISIYWLFMAICCAGILTANASDEQPELIGGRNEIGRDEWPELFKKVSESLARLATQENGPSFNLEEILMAEKQMVAGLKYYINARVTPAQSASKICKFEIWEKIWEKFQQVDVSCEDGAEYQVLQSSESNRVRRSEPLGSPRDVDAENLKRLEGIIQESLVDIGQQNNGRKLSFIRIKDATSKRVTGTLYTVTIEVSEQDADNSECVVEIWEKKWLEFRETTAKCGTDEFKVSKTRAKRSLNKPLLEDDEFDVDADSKAAKSFQQFKTTFNRTYYDAQEHALRYRIFKQNLFLIDQLNKYEMGTAEYGITEFADLTSKEYFLRTGLRLRDGGDNRIPNAPAEIPNIELPPSFDWREKGAVTEVKNQGNCGSCWAFSVTGNIEGVNAARTGTLVSYSEQELLDCDTVDGACNGGLPDDAYKAIERIGGLETEQEYPYRAHKEKCQYDPSLDHVTVHGAVDLPKDEDAIAKYLVQNGPVSIGINANGMQFYHRGVAHPWKALCRPDSLDHGVLIVGFGVDQGKKNKQLPFWIVKNSWGPRWGEQGYYRVYRGDNTCGVASMVSSAILE